MNEIKIKDVESLIEQLNSLPNHFLFRGQADAGWSLKSSLERAIGDRFDTTNSRKFEERSLQFFKSKFHLYDYENKEPASKLAWLSIMQHYGVPTRLIDFTESPFVALYFALENYAPQLAKDFVVYALDYTATMDKSLEIISRHDKSFKEDRFSLQEKQDVVFDEVVDRFSYDIVWIAEPSQMNARLDRQAGSFIMSGNVGKRIEELLSSDEYGEIEMFKYVIPNELYSCVYALLRKMNITSKSLYGDLHGLAHSIKMEMQVYSYEQETRSL